MVSLLLCALASAQETPDSQVRDRQVKTLARVLAYDESLTKRAGSRVVIGVLYKAGSPDVQNEPTEWFAAFSKLESYNIRGLPIHAVMLPFTTPEVLQESVSGRNIVALYICPGLEGEIANIKRISRERKTTTIASREDMVHAGLTLGVFSEHGKLSVVVNLAASRAEGAQFGSDLLRLAKVIQ
jgi:hypothetical protein